MPATLEEDSAPLEAKPENSMEKTPETDKPVEPEDDGDVVSPLPEEGSKGGVPEKRKASDDSIDGSLENHFTVFDDSFDEVPIGSLNPATVGGSTQPLAVTPARKEELLLEARADRIQWIQQVPLPYRKIVDKGDPWNQDEKLSTFRSSHAGKHLPAAFTVLSHLYGMQASTSPTEVAARLESIVGSHQKETEKAFPSGDDMLKAELAAMHDSPVLKGYHTFWSQLQEPECAPLVQGMRRFCRVLRDLDDADVVASKMKAYLESTRESLKSHALWKKSGVDESVRRQLESFVYGQCHASLESVLYTEKEAAKEKAWMERIESLQFVTPLHLEITCLGEDNLDLDTLLKDPIDALRSVDTYYSPYEKLQTILAVYHGVNAALAVALNQNRGDESRKLPSADDVLPTIILTVLRAKPERLYFDLQMVEDFCPAEYLRGEAGYAYTNLFGAVQFLQDLDLEQEPKSLSISPDELRKGLEACRAASTERLDRATAVVEESKSPKVESPAFAMIPPQAIRAARRRGEDLSLEWALQWQKEQLNAEGDEMEERKVTGRAVVEEVTEQLPHGFTRNYSFLTTRPDDVKVSDLPQLLSEYRMLVHATETLLGQRTAKASAERKQRALVAQQELMAVVREVDPSLLPDVAGSRSKSF
jgi:hypothetical protein